MASFATDISKKEAQALADGMKGALHNFEVFPGVRLNGAYDPGGIWVMMELENICRGKRVLEIGPAEGYFSKRLADAGAILTVMDYRSKEESGFWLMERLSGIKFNYVQGNVMDDGALDALGVFDIVLFMGVLYHLPDPIRALDNLRSVCSGTMIIETLCDIDLPANVPAARYFKSNSLGGDWTNFWAPNTACLEGMLLDSGFACRRKHNWGDRVLIVSDVIEGPHMRLKNDIAYSWRRLTG